MIDRQIIKCTKKLNISEKGPYTFKNLGMKNRWINELDKKKTNDIIYCKTDWLLVPGGDPLHQGILRMEIKLSYQQLQPDDQWAVPRRIHWHLKDKGKLKFVETSAYNEIFKGFWGKTSFCSVNNKIYTWWWISNS